jgi:L-amino acid N-acyltransferase YncA
LGFGGNGPVLNGVLVCADHRRLPHVVRAAQGIPSAGVLHTAKLQHLIPVHSTLRKRKQLNNGKSTNDVPVVLENFHEHDWPAGLQLMNDVITEGKSWPFDTPFPDATSFRGYFLSHDAYVVRNTANSQVVGAFYIKPNFPGRCSHVCNGGFITHPDYRGCGIGTLMGSVFLRLARDIGYRSVYFNLVFKSNAVSVRLWESLGFRRVATLENAADLEGTEGLDTAYGYSYNLDLLPADYCPWVVGGVK